MAARVRGGRPGRLIARLLAAATATALAVTAVGWQPTAYAVIADPRLVAATVDRATFNARIRGYRHPVLPARCRARRSGQSGGHILGVPPRQWVARSNRTRGRKPHLGPPGDMTPAATRTASDGLLARGLIVGCVEQICTD